MKSSSDDADSSGSGSGSNGSSGPGSGSGPSSALRDASNGRCRRRPRGNPIEHSARSQIPRLHPEVDADPRGGGGSASRCGGPAPSGVLGPRPSAGARPEPDRSEEGPRGAEAADGRDEDPPLRRVRGTNQVEAVFLLPVVCSV